MSELKTVIGLEVHVQLSTISKLFAPEKNSFGAAANQDISDVTIAHPGSLPVLNMEAVRSAVKLGLALNCEIADDVTFDRKNYFYPDLPKGYQITQDRNPICQKGGLWVEGSKDKDKFISLTKIHMEEDAGKSIHHEDGKTHVDLNRSGVPLLEIVTDPVIENSEQASLFLIEIRKLIRYLAISNGNMEEGSLRCDANISLHRAGEPLGNKVEVKNMNSFKNVSRAIESEIARQSQIISKGEKVLSETRTYLPGKDITRGMRTKEQLNDYRYFPEPDIAPVLISDQFKAQIKKELPILPSEAQSKMVEEFGIDRKEAMVICEELSFYRFFEKTIDLCKEPLQVKNWLIGPIKGLLNEKKASIDEVNLTPVQLAEILTLIKRKEISHTTAQNLLPSIFEGIGQKSVKDLAGEMNLLQERNVYEIVPVIDEVLHENQNKVKEYQNGKKGLIGMFMGQIMKKTAGKIDPQLTNKLLVEKLNTYKK